MACRVCMGDGMVGIDAEERCAQHLRGKSGMIRHSVLHLSPQLHTPQLDSPLHLLPQLHRPLQLAWETETPCMTSPTNRLLPTDHP